MIAFATSYIILFWHVCLLSHGSLFFSNERCKGNGSGGTGGRENLGGVGEKSMIRIYFTKKIMCFQSNGEKEN